MTKCILGVDIGKTNIRVAISQGTPDLKSARSMLEVATRQRRAWPAAPAGGR